jgi:hypothetical protein
MLPLLLWLLMMLLMMVVMLYVSEPGDAVGSDNRPR